MGQLRDQLSRVISARGPVVVCFLLASTLLTGCHETSTTSTSSSAAASTPATTVKSVDVSWTPPTTNTNGSALTDLAGYRLYYGTSPGSLKESVDVPNPGTTDYVVPGLTEGTWYFAVVAYTNTGLQSSESGVVSKTIT